MAEMMKKFGKYFLLDQIAQGGMAEIYRARMATSEVGGRLLAIKRIIQSYSANPEFVKMFESEIKTIGAFTHPNIVQLYDFGKEQGMLYIAMEYVDGKNLRQFISRFTEIKTPFPVEAAVYILEQCAHGMAYAHGFKDKFSGKSMNIVHRDISPQNILISYDGAVKVIDFGIAKADEENREATRAGVIKGKPSYLSPEQIAGEDLDGRSDLFALGIVFWELLAGRKCFQADNDFAVLKLIENCNTHVKPPSMYNPKVPKELDAIVMKCLQKNRDQRYGTSEELQRALHKFLYQFAPDFNPADLAYYARDMFKNEIVEDRKKLLKLNEKAEQLLVAQGGDRGMSNGSSDPDNEATLALTKPDSTRTEVTATATSQKTPPKDKGGSFRMLDVPKDQVAAKPADVKLDFGAGGAPKPGIATPAPGMGQGGRQGPGAYAPAANGTKFIQNANRTGKTVTGMAYQEKSSPASLVAALLLIAALGGGYWYYTKEMQGPSPASVAAATVKVTGNVQAATVMLDDKPVASELPATLNSVPTDKPVRMVVTSNGYKKFVRVLQLTGGETKLVNVSLERETDSVVSAEGSAPAAGAGDPSGAPLAATQVRPITLKINVTPAGLGSHMKIDGKMLDSSGVTTVMTDTPFEIIVERDGFRSHREKLVVDSAKAGVAKEWSIDIALQSAKFGFVSIKTTPSADVIVKIDGVEEKWQGPVSRRRVPAGEYKAKLVNSLLGMEKEITFSVSEDRFTNIEERLSPSADAPSRLPSSR